jgi:hypothetical protein
MIKSAHIRHFKGLSELEVHDLTRVTLLGGRNNVGKTSFLEALFVYFERSNPDAFIRQHAWRNITMVALNPEALWAPMFAMYDMNKSIEISILDDKGKTGSLTLKLNRNYGRKFVPSRPAWPDTNGQINTQAKPSPNVSLDVTYRFDRNSPQELHHFISPQGMGLEMENQTMQSETAIFLAATTSRISPQEDAIRFGQLDILGKQQEIVDFLRETVEPRLQSLSTIAVGNQSLIHAQLEGSTRKMPVAYMGEGMARLLSVILVLTTTSNGYVFIDEIENGIHYSALPKIWLGIVKAAQRFNCQVFATTHSHECLQAAIQALPEALQGQFCYVRLERTGERIQGKTYSYEVLGAALERDWEVR